MLLASSTSCISLLACFAHLACLFTPSPLMHCLVDWISDTLISNTLIDWISSCLPVHSFSTHALLQGKQQRADEAEGPAAPATKRQRTGKAILNVSSYQHLLATDMTFWMPSQAIHTSKVPFLPTQKHMLSFSRLIMISFSAFSAFY